jgi:putative ABC transport system permease protein
MLGVIIGVAAVIVIVSMGNGMSAQMEKSIESMGTNLITVSIRGRGSSRQVTETEMYQLVSDNPELLTAVTPNVDISITAKYGDTSLSTTASGVGEDFCSIKNYSVSQGRFLQYIDILRRQNVCVVGSYIAQELFGGSALGQSVKINGIPYTIVGVLEEKAGSEEGSDDDHIFIPYTNAIKMSWQSTISTYYFSSVDDSLYEQSVTAIESELYDIYEDENAYSVRSMAESLETLTSLTDTMVLVLSAIAAISLLVGGIGIMNIMLVSVTERTREIGIRKSLGAKRRDIMRQFVIEAATTSTIGGGFGIFLGIILSNFAANMLDMTAVTSLNAILTAFGVSLAIGVIFGFLPANKAAKLNPIEALRYD